MFDKDFIFGCATSSYQIEGSKNEDGKRTSIWDTFCKIPGKIADSSSGEIACDSYHRYKEDVKLIKELGCDSYRFSIAWSRVQDELGNPIEKGIEYYKNLCKELINNGIKPLITLYHWDMPQYIADKGGFLNNDFPNWFESYTELITKELGDLCKAWITVNEPQVILFLGYREASHAPGLSLDNKDMLVCIHNLLKAHGKSVKVIRKNVKDSTVGFAPCSRGVVPISNDEKLYKKCYERYYSLGSDYFFPNLVSVYSDPVFLGDYPKEYYERFKDILPNITKEDLELINQPLDYCYQNVYSGDYYDLDEEGQLIMLPPTQGCEMGNVDWLRVVPEALYYIPVFLYERYKTPVIISENGITLCDNQSLDGKIHDESRSAFIYKYLSCLAIASKKVKVKGYYYWSLLDNFEWAYGYTKRFGLVYVDYQTQERIPKDAFYTYKDIISRR